MQAPQKMCPQFVECGCLPTDESIQTAQITVFSWRSVSFGTVAADLTVSGAVEPSFLNREFSSKTGNILDAGPLTGEHKFITLVAWLCSPTKITSSSLSFKLLDGAAEMNRSKRKCCMVTGQLIKQ